MTVLFLGRSEQELTAKIDIFQQMFIFLLSIAAKREIEISRFY